MTYGNNLKKSMRGNYKLIQISTKAYRHYETYIKRKFNTEQAKHLLRLQMTAYINAGNETFQYKTIKDNNRLYFVDYLRIYVSDDFVYDIRMATYRHETPVMFHRIYHFYRKILGITKKGKNYISDMVEINPNK